MSGSLSSVSIRSIGGISKKSISAGLQRLQRGLRVRHVLVDDAIDLDVLRARHAGRRLGARDVVRIAVVDVARAHPRLVAIVGERPGADIFGDLLVRIGLGFLLAHDVEDRRRGLRHDLEHQAVGLLQGDREGLVVLLRKVLHARHHVLAGAVARGPAADRGDHVVGGDGGAVGELQPVAQLERIGELVVGKAPLADHLRLRTHLGVEREQRVVDHRAVIGGDVRGGPDRIERAQVALHHGADGAGARRLRADDARHAGKRGRGKRALNETAASGAHGVSPCSLALRDLLTEWRRETSAPFGRAGAQPRVCLTCGSVMRRSAICISARRESP